MVDDREGISTGEKLADADLIGIPYQIIIGDKTAEDEVEIKDRKTGKVEIVKIAEIKKIINN